MNNPYRQLINLLNLGSPSAQGPDLVYSWLFILLSEKAAQFDASPDALTHPNCPGLEVLHRLRAYANTFAYKRAAQAINTCIERNC